MSQERTSSRHKKAGPLTLQMGAVTGAVDDLVHGYEQLVHALPNLTEKISNVHADTEQMAKALEHRTRNLVEGYEYIQGLATQLPEMFKETAEQHRKTLQGAIHALGPDEQAIIAANDEKLTKIKMEMQLMCHERIVGDVLMRPLITETKRIHEQAKKAESEIQQKQYARNLADASSRANINNTTANRVLNSRVVSQNSTGARPTAAFMSPSTNNTISTNSANKIGHRGSTVVLTNSRNTELGDIHVSYKDTAEHLSTPIYIPPYEYNRPRPPAAAGNIQKHGHGGELGGFLNFNYDYEGRAGDVIHSGYSRLVARSVNEKKMVPSMRHGSLPPEVANLYTHPTEAPSASDYLVLTNRKKSIKRKVTFVEKETIAKSLVSKLQHTETEVEELKKKLGAAHNKFGKDQSAAIAKLHALILELQNANNGRDEALIAAVEALLREYQLKQKAAPAVNHDAAILKALEMLLTPPPPVIDRLHEYKVLTVRPKVPVPVRTVPVVVPVPAPHVEVESKVEVKEIPVEVEVQTDPVPVPVVPAPVAPVVAPVMQHPQQVIVNVPAQNTVERELIDLMHNVVNTQHQTMQGNQALILSLIHERNTQNVYEEVIEYTPPPVEEEPTPTPVEAPPAAPVATPPPALPTLPQYSTALGTVVLGAQILEGPYTTPPTLIPTEHKPCILRGIPPPERRPIQPPRRVPEEKNVLVAGDLVPAHQPSTHTGDDTAQDTIAIDKEEPSKVPTDATEKSGSSIPTTSVTTNRAGAADNAATNNSTTSAAAAEPVQLLNTPMDNNTNLGLTLSGNSSTSDGGGSRMHSTPGVVHMVPSHTIPPYMRRKASDFTLRALLGSNYLGSGAYSQCNNTDNIGVNSNTTMYKNSLGFNAEADAKVAGKNINNVAGAYANTLGTTEGTTHPVDTTNVANTGDQGLNNLFRNLQILSSAPIHSPTNGVTSHSSAHTNNNNNATTATANTATAITPEVLAQQISEGVQRGVKEALGLMDTHRTHRTYYNTNPSANDVLHHPTNGVDAPHDKLNYDTRGLLHHSMYDTPDDIRKSLTLLKNKRSSRRGNSLNAGVRSTYYSNQPHCTNHTDQSNYNTNYIEHNHVANRDMCQPPRRKAIAQQQRQAEHKSIMQDILYSTTNTHNMINGDENSSFNDSVSLDETTAAYLRDPLTYNMHSENPFKDGNSVVSSLDCDIGVNNNKKTANVKLMRKNVHTKKHSELFASTDDAPIKVHPAPKAYKTTANNNNNTSEEVQGFVPLISRVLQQSATEDVLYHQLYARPAASDSVDSTSVYGNSGYGKNIDNDADNDAKMWDLTASAPLVTFKTNETTADNANQPSKNVKLTTHANHTDGTLATMKLLSRKHYEQNEMKLHQSEDSFVSIGSSVEYSSTSDRSILTHSTNSTDISVADSKMDTAVDQPLHTAVPADAHANVASTYKRTSTTDINRANLVAQSMNPSVTNSVNSLNSDTSSSHGSTNSRRASLLPRYSPHKHNKSSSYTDANPATHRSARANTNTDNTDQLAAHMMLNVLELHRPSNYTTTPYLSNPITSHLTRNGYPTSARSKIYATKSVDSASSNSVTDRRYTNNRYFNTDPDSDLDCTGSSISSAPDQLLEHALYNNNVNSYSDTANKPKSGLTLMGVGSNKLLRIHRK